MTVFGCSGRKVNKMGREWWIHKIWGYKSKAKLTGRVGKKNQLKRKMAGNNLLHFTARAQPHIQYQSWNKPNQDTTKKEPKTTTTKFQIKTRRNTVKLHKERHLKIVQMLQINVQIKRKTRKKGESIRTDWKPISSKRKPVLANCQNNIGLTVLFFLMTKIKREK